MKGEEWHPDLIDTHDEYEVTKSNSPEDALDHFGVKLSLLILCVAFFIAAIWVVTGPSFEKCSSLENVTQRNVCYGELRNDLFKPRARGAEILAS
jgi:hypothetical protein